MDLIKAIHVLFVTCVILSVVNTAVNVDTLQKISDRRNERNTRKFIHRKLNERQFMRKIGRRLKNKGKLFSEKAVKMIENGWNMLPLPHQINRRAFGLCDIRQEFDVVRMFPGLFRTTADIFNLPEMQTKGQSNRNTKGQGIIPHRPSKFGAAKRIRIPQEVERKAPENINNAPLASFTPIRQAARSVNRSTGFDNANVPFICDCCKTDRYFEAYDNVTLNDATYKVISLPSAKQFYATERCPKKPKCVFGGCIQRYTTHFILIWNGTKPYYPALDFTPIEVPSHCEWANIGI